MSLIYKVLIEGGKDNQTDDESVPVISDLALDHLKVDEMFICLLLPLVFALVKVYLIDLVPLLNSLTAQSM